MAHIFEDRVLESSTTTGTGSLTVAGALAGFRTFASVCATSDTFWYAAWAVDANGNATGAYEEGLGTYASANTVARTTVLRSSNSDAAVNFAAGTKHVALAAVGPRVMQLDNNLCTLLPDASGMTVPSTGLSLFTRSIATRRLPAFVGPAGLDSSLQPFLARNAVGYWRAAPGATTLTGAGLTLTATGTATATAPATTNLATSTLALEFAVTTAATTAVGGFRVGTAATGLSLWRGNATGRGGFTFVCRFRSMRAWPATQRCFVGVANATAAPTDVEPSSQTNILGVGHDAADGNWQLLLNDGAGTATKVNTGIARPTADNQLLELILFARPNDATVYWQFTEHVAGTSFSHSATADIPASTTFLTPRGYKSVGGTSSTVGLGVLSVYTETDY